MVHVFKVFKTVKERHLDFSLLTPPGENYQRFLVLRAMIVLFRYACVMESPSKSYMLPRPTLITQES